MSQQLSIWWIRILAYLAWTSSGLLGLQLIPASNEIRIIFLTLYLAGGIIAIEVARRGGTVFTSGLGITPRMPLHTAIGAGFAMVMQGSIAGVAVLMEAGFTLDHEQAFALTVVAITAQSVLEEFLFRGTILEALRERFGTIVSVGLTSVLFGVAHGLNPGASPIAVVNVTLAGGLMGIMVVRSGSLWMAMAFHAAWNLSTKTFFGSVSGAGEHGWISTLDAASMPPEIVWFLTGPFGIEQGVVTTIVLIAGIVVVNGWVRTDRAVAAARIRRYRLEHPTV